MAESRAFVPNDHQIGCYLLGLLPDDESERIDEASIVDDDVAARLRIAEDDLVDAYVSGTLDGDTRERFERFYLSSPRRRDKVAAARRFLAAVDRAPVPGGVVPATDRPRGMSVRSRAVWFAAAAAVFLVTCSALLLDNARLRQGLRQARRDSVASDRRGETLAQQLEAGRAEKDEAVKALAAAHAALAARERAADGPPPTVADAARLAPLALVLSPQTRAVGPVPAIAISPSLQQLAFELRLELNDFARYRVELKDPASGRTVWRSGALPARAAHGAAFVSIVVPRAVLPREHGVLELAGLSAADRAEPVASYTFQIIQP